MDTKARTLDDYMPQIYCGEDVPLIDHQYATAGYMSLNMFYLCDKKPNHKGDCSSMASRHER